MYGGSYVLLFILSSPLLKTSAEGMRFKLVSRTSEQIWDVKLITLTDDHGNKLPVTEFFDSNHAKLPRYRYTPVQAFKDNNKWWGGRKDDNGVFEIGGETPCFQGNTLTVELLHPGPTHAVTQGVQFMVEKNGIWEEKCNMTMKSEVFNGPEVDEYAMYCEIRAPGMKFKLVSPTSEQQIWDVKLITLTDDHGNKLPVTEFFDSNHAKHPRDRYTPVQAFTDNNKWWGGRKDDNGVFEIGGETPYFPGNTLTVELLHPGPTHAVTQGVQFMVEKNGIWEEKCIMTMKSEEFIGPEVDEYAMYCEIEEWNCEWTI